MKAAEWMGRTMKSSFREKGRRVAFVTEGSYMGCRFTFAYDEDDVVDFGITESSRGE